MFSWKEFQKTKNILSQDNSYLDLVGQHHLIIRPINLIKWIELAKEDLGFLTLVDISGVDFTGLSDHGYNFELTYHLLNMGSHQRLNLHVRFDQDEVTPSIVDLFSHADWMEREQQEAFGVRFNRKMGALLLPRNQKNYPLLKNAKISKWPIDPPESLPEINTNPNKSEAPYPEEAFVWKNYDTFSPITSGMFEWMVCYDPVKIVDTKVNIGFHYQGLEKLLEKKDWQQVLQLVDKINLGAAPTYGIAWAKTLEDILRIKLPERAQAIRIVTLELARIAEHLTVMHEITFSLKMDEQRLFINAREKIYELIEKFCGRRQGLSVARIGGIKEDLPQGWIIEYQTVCAIVSKALRLIHRSLFSQSNFREQLDGGMVSAQTALEWGVSGPAMRACGLNFDLRKSQPFYFYQDIDFDIPVGINGTAYERYLIRYEEIFQSFRIITQVIDNLPLGEIMNPDLDKGFMEVKEYIGGLDFPKGWHYNGIESPNGEAGFLVLFQDSFAPYRVKIKTPSFPLAQALSHFVTGIQEGQLRVYLASLGIRQFELDR
jgi:NADH-quinone oxidoreductase subunit C/D